MQGDGQLQIGCQKFSLDEWLAKHKKNGRKQKYTTSEIAAYGKVIRLCKELQEGE